MNRMITYFFNVQARVSCLCRFILYFGCESERTIGDLCYLVFKKFFMYIIDVDCVLTTNAIQSMNGGDIISIPFL